MRWISLVALLVLLSCSNKKNAPDVSHIKTDVTIHRFDKDFFALDTTQLQTSLLQVEKKYPAFLAVYFKFFAPVREIALGKGISFDSALVEYYSYIKPMAQVAEQKFSNLDNIENDLENYLRYARHYFPNFKTPVVLTSVESLNPENPEEIYGTSYFQDTLVISLQMFLGKDYPAYASGRYPASL